MLFVHLYQENVEVEVFAGITGRVQTYSQMKCNIE